MQFFFEKRIVEKKIRAVNLAKKVIPDQTL